MWKVVIENVLVHEIYRALAQSADFTTETQQEKIARSPTIQRCLSVQDSLGRQPGHGGRSVAAKVAWATLNLRFVSLSLAILLNNGMKVVGGGDGDLSKPGQSSFSDWQCGR